MFFGRCVKVNIFLAEPGLIIAHMFVDKRKGSVVITQSDSDLFVVCAVTFAVFVPWNWRRKNLPILFKLISLSSVPLYIKKYIYFDWPGVAGVFL